MSLTEFITEKIDPTLRAREIGVFGSRGGYLVIDEDLDEAFTWVHVGSGGNIVMKGLDNNPIPFFNATAGSCLPGLFKGVMSSAEVDGYGTLETTASSLTWHGGNGVTYL